VISEFDLGPGPRHITYTYSAEDGVFAWQGRVNKEDEWVEIGPVTMTGNGMFPIPMEFQHVRLISRAYRP